MLKKYLWINGKIQLANKPTIFVDDVGFLRGYGVFDFMRTYNGKIFRYHDHYQRFANSAKLLDLKVTRSEKELEQVIYKLIKKNGLKEASIRLIVTGGRAIDGLNYDPQKLTLAILVEDVYELPSKLFKTGARLMTFDYQRLIPEAKNLNYIWAVKLQREKVRRGAIEILYVNRNKILECSTSNIFLVRKNRLITPREGILSGVTRRMVIGLAQKAGYQVEERDIKISEMRGADEIFITATNKNILPIVKIDEVKIGTGNPGPLTKELLALYKKEIENY